MTRTIAVVSAGLSDPSSTRLLTELLAAATATALVLRAASDLEPVETTVVELRSLADALTDHLLTGSPSGDLATAVRTVAEADAVIAVTAVFSASFCGLFKSFFDILEPGALDGTPVLVAATAGSARRSVVLERALRPLFGHLRAAVVPIGVFAASRDFGSTGAGTSLQSRVDRASGEFAALLVGRPGAAKSVQSDHGLTARVDFEDLLDG